MIRPSAECFLSPEQIEIAAVPGATEIVVRSSTIYGHYLRRKGSAWRFAARDGSDLDADGAINGEIVIRLSALGRLKGSPQPPDNVTVGDVVLLIDSDQMRASSVEVKQ